MTSKKKYPEGTPMLGVGALNDLDPQNIKFIKEIVGLVNGQPAILLDPQLMTYLRLAVFTAKAGDDVQAIAQKLNAEMKDYLVQHQFQGPVGLKQLQAAVKTYL